MCNLTQPLFVPVIADDTSCLVMFIDVRVMKVGGVTDEGGVLLMGGVLVVGGV